MMTSIFKKSVFILLLFLAITKISWAQTEPSLGITIDAKKIEQTLKNHWGKELVRHNAHTVFLLTVLGISKEVSTYVQEFLKTEDPYAFIKLQESILEIIKTIPVSPSLYAQIAGTRAAESLIQGGLKLTGLEQAAYSNFLAANIIGFVCFFGWEFGRELYQKAVDRFSEKTPYAVETYRTQSMLTLLSDPDLLQRFLGCVLEVLEDSNNLQRMYEGAIYQWWTVDMGATYIALALGSAVGKIAAAKLALIAGLPFGPMTAVFSLICITAFVLAKESDLIQDNIIIPMEDGFTLASRDIHYREALKNLYAAAPLFYFPKNKESISLQESLQNHRKERQAMIEQHLKLMASQFRKIFPLLMSTYGIEKHEKFLIDSITEDKNQTRKELAIKNILLEADKIRQIQKILKKEDYSDLDPVKSPEKVNSEIKQLTHLLETQKDPKHPSFNIPMSLKEVIETSEKTIYKDHTRPMTAYGNSLSQTADLAAPSELEEHAQELKRAPWKEIHPYEIRPLMDWLKDYRLPKEMKKELMIKAIQKPKPTHIITAELEMVIELLIHNEHPILNILMSPDEILAPSQSPPWSSTFIAPLHPYRHREPERKSTIHRYAVKRLYEWLNDDRLPKNFKKDMVVKAAQKFKKIHEEEKQKADMILELYDFSSKEAEAQKMLSPDIYLSIQEFLALKKELEHFLNTTSEQLKTGIKEGKDTPLFQKEKNRAEKLKSAFTDLFNWTEHKNLLITEKLSIFRKFTFHPFYEEDFLKNYDQFMEIKNKELFSKRLKEVQFFIQEMSQEYIEIKRKEAKKKEEPFKEPEAEEIYNYIMTQLKEFDSQK